MLSIVPGSEVQTPSSGVKMDSSAFREAALAPGKVAAAIGQNVGGLFEEVSANVQANQNARQVFNADLAMRKTKDNFDASLAARPDEGTWLPAWKEQVDQLRESTLENPHVGPDVRRVLEQKFDIYEATTSGALRSKALLKSASETRTSAIASATYAAHQGDLESANNTIDAAVAHFAMTPAEAKKQKLQFPSIAAQSQADTAINTNPIKAPELIKRFEGTIDPKVMVGITTRAREAQHAAQASNLSEWSQRLDDGPDHTIDTKMLAADRDSGAISQTGYDSIISRQKRMFAEDKKEAARTDRDEALLIGQDLINTNFVGDKAPKETDAGFTDRINGITDVAMRNRLTEQLKRKRDAADKNADSAEKPEIAKQLKMMDADFTDGSAFVPMTNGKPAVKGSWGSSDEPEQPPGHIPGGMKGIEKIYDKSADHVEFHQLFGNDTKLVDVKEAARLNLARKQKEFLDWAHDPANKDKVADPDQVNAERKRIEYSDVSKAVNHAITSNVPRAVNSKEEADALEPGPDGKVHFIYRGKVYTK